MRCGRGSMLAQRDPPAYTVEQCWELVETKLKTGRHSYGCSTELPVLARTYDGSERGLQGRVRDGHVRGVELYPRHSDLLFEKTGALSWRGEVAHANRGDNYPTHALAPLSLWMGINRGEVTVSRFDGLAWILGTRVSGITLANTSARIIRRRRKVSSHEEIRRSLWRIPRSTDCLF